jgi:hypothetical protein
MSLVAQNFDIFLVNVLTDKRTAMHSVAHTNAHENMTSWGVFLMV